MKRRAFFQGLVGLAAAAAGVVFGGKKKEPSGLFAHAQMRGDSEASSVTISSDGMRAIDDMMWNLFPVDPPILASVRRHEEKTGEKLKCAYRIRENMPQGRKNNA